MVVGALRAAVYGVQLAREGVQRGDRLDELAGYELGAAATARKLRL
ncbi:hypothetical protein KDA23_05545 [Candidatus Saccharibacteria bacterium]|nr:hypothetical protein [Candidatus Saccharibacteria bacterium]